MRKRGLEKVILAGVIISLIIPLLSAGAFSDFLEGIGLSPDQPTDVTIDVTGANPPEVIWVDIKDALIDANETSSKPINFTVIMYDPDGVNDLDDFSVKTNFTRTGQTTRENSSCLWVIDNDPASKSANYSCTLTMWYWDGNGLWDIEASGSDLGGQIAYNLSETFQYNLLRAMEISPTVLTWPSLMSGQTDAGSDNDPTTINNTGNYLGNIDTTGYDLLGENFPENYIPASAFNINITDFADGTSLLNETAITIINSDSNRGNLSEGGGAGQETFYYYVDVPAIPSQTYSTSVSGFQWRIIYP